MLKNSYDAGSSTRRFARDGGAALLIVLVVFNFAAARRAYFAGYFPIVSFPIAGICALAALIFAVKKWRPLTLFQSALILLLLQAAIAVEFLRTAQGRLIFSDDHPSFLYRLKLLLDHFPHIPFYNTDWNAGYIASEFAAVGTYGVFILSWPLLKLFPNFGTVDGSFVYTLLIPYLYILLIPIAVFAGARALRFDPLTAFVSGMLALGPSLLESEWLLKYGTLGFVLASGFIPVLFAYSFRVLFDEETPRMRDILLLGPIGFLAVSWPMACLLTVPLIVLTVVWWKSALTRIKPILIAGVMFCVLAGPMFQLLLFRSRALSVIRTESTADASWTASSAKENTKTENQYSFQMLLRQSNPLLLAFALPGVLLLRGRRRTFWAAALLWTFSLAAFGDLVRPQLEFRRLLLPFAFLSLYPASTGIVFFLRSVLSDTQWTRRSDWLQLLAGAVVCGALILSPLPVRAAYKDRAADPSLRFTFASEEVARLTESIRENAGEGRTMFLGFVLHELGAQAHDNTDGGHVAALAPFTGRELFAYYYYHYSWTSVDPMPLSVRRGSDAGVEEFLDLLNVSSVITFDTTWRRYAKRQKNYTEVYKSDRFRIYRRASAGLGPFLKGSGTVERTKDGLTVIPEAEEMVIKYRYFPSLTVDPALAEISPMLAYENDLPNEKKEQIEFIRLHVSPEALAAKSPIRIEMK